MLEFLRRLGGEEMAWHVEHYGSLGIMQKIDTSDAVAKIMGISPEKLEATWAEVRAPVTPGASGPGVRVSRGKSPAPD